MYPFKYSFSLTYSSISSLLTPEMRRRVKCQPFERERARVDLINLLPCNRFQSVVPYLVRIIKQLWIMIAHKIYPRKSDDDERVTMGVIKIFQLLSLPSTASTRRRFPIKFITFFNENDLFVCIISSRFDSTGEICALEKQQPGAEKSKIKHETREIIKILSAHNSCEMQCQTIPFAAFSITQRR